jgi:[ribosomal protein S5]-alanine N-acetyltransferase
VSRGAGVAGGTPEGQVELVRLDLATMAALLDEDLARASELAGVSLTPFFLSENWLWRIRHAQVLADPVAGDWVARAALVDGAVVGHVGFHGPPDERGMVEVAYAVDPELRRRGHARRLLGAALAWAEAAPGVRTVRASISPDNTASLATIAPFGFTHVGEQWDDEDGLELLYERPVDG